MLPLEVLRRPPYNLAFALSDQHFFRSLQNSPFSEVFKTHLGQKCYKILSINRCQVLHWLSTPHTWKQQPPLLSTTPLWHRGNQKSRTNCHGRDISACTGRLIHILKSSTEFNKPWMVGHTRLLNFKKYCVQQWSAKKWGNYLISIRKRFAF